MTGSTSPLDTVRWVDAWLRDEDVPYQMLGVVAALVHGTSAPTGAWSQIDLLVGAAHLPRLLRAMPQPPTLAPWRRRYTHWDLVTTTLAPRDVPVVIGVADGARIRMTATDAWREVEVDVTTAARHPTVGALALPVGSHPPLPAEGFVE